MYRSSNKPLALSRRANCIAPVLALLLAFHAGAAAAQQPDSSPASVAQGWHISGKVIDARSGQALARCVVEINPTDDRSQSLSLETSDDGRFDFAGLRLGKYDLSASKRGYLTQSYQQHETFSTAIAVGPELKSEDLLFNLTPQAIFYGTVSDETGEPIRRAQVRLYEDRDLDGIRSTQTRQTVITDDRGMYEIPNIAPGNYFLSVSAQPWYASAVNGARPPMQFEDTQASKLDSALDVAYPTIFYPDAIDSDDAIPIPIRGGEQIEANMTLTAQRAMHLHLPIARGQEGGTGVSIAQTVFGQLEPIPTIVQANKEAVEISGVLPGRYEVTVTHSDGQSPAESTHFTADIADGATQLSADSSVGEVTVTGKVTSLDSKLRSAFISLVASHPQRGYLAPLNNAGEFTVQVMPGEYQVVGQIPQMYLAAVSSPNALVKGHMLEVKAGDAPRLEILAANGYGRIEGLAERAGHPTGGVMVLLAPEDAKDNQILFRRDQSDSDGTFLLSDIIPGRYRLLAIDDGWELNWADPNVLAAYLKKSITFQVHAHDKLKQTVEVQSR
jgi:protocatechuate 3,4-dioxygenase beta subunit